MPAATVIASSDAGLARRLQEIVTGDTLRVYTNDDVVGVEFCGAAKNPIAIAVGIADGLGFGDNTRAALMTRSLAKWRASACASAPTSPPSPAWPASATSWPPAPRSTAATAGRASSSARGESAQRVQETIGQVVEASPRRMRCTT